MTIPFKIPRFALQCEKPVNGRCVRVVKYPLTSNLMICEFEVYGEVKGVRNPTIDRQNLALNKPTSINGATFHGRPPGKVQPRSPFMAVDGNRDGYSSALVKCFCTDKAADIFMFLVDLGDVYIALPAILSGKQVS